MMECPNCKEIALPEPDGGECEDCGIPAYFHHSEERGIGYWHWMYNHPFGSDDGWLVQSTIGFIRRAFHLGA